MKAKVNSNLKSFSLFDPSNKKSLPNVKNSYSPILFNGQTILSAKALDEIDETSFNTIKTKI